MRESLKVRIVSVLERTGLATAVDGIAHLIAKYVCRLVGSREYRKQIRSILLGYPELQEEFINLKNQLDYASVRNNLLRAVHALTKLQKPNRQSVVNAARRFGIDCLDLDFVYQSLSLQDLTSVAALQLSERNYSDEEIIKILKQIEYLMKNLVYRRMSFVLNNDPMIENSEDLISPLRIAAMKVIREYEIRDITYEHMLSMVIKGVQNQANNMAEKHGRGKRQPVMRAVVRDDHRILWHFDIHRNLIHPVRAYKDQSLRQKVGTNICVAVQDTATNNWIVVHHKRLYISKREAVAAQVAKLAGMPSKRSAYVDLAPQQIDDFQSSTVSIDNDRLNVNFHEHLPSKASPELPEAVHRMRQILHGLPPRSREFAELVFSSAVDELFDAWCEENGYNPTTCDEQQLGRILCHYLKVSKTALKADLANSAASLWSSWQKELILRGSKDTPDK